MELIGRHSRVNIPSLITSAFKTVARRVKEVLKVSTFYGED